MFNNIKALLLFSIMGSLFSFAQQAEGSEGLPLPQIPDSLTSREQKINYAVTHFWDCMDFSDSTKAEDEAFMEQSLVNFFLFLGVMADNDPGDIQAPINQLFHHCAINPNCYKLIGKLASKYLYDFPSPMRNENVYEVFIEAQLNDTLISPTQRLRLEEEKTLMNLNRPGHKLNDFEFITSDNVSHNFHEYRDINSNVLLIFYDPDCDECLETILLLSQNDELNKDIASRQWQVYAIARFDTESSWRNLLQRLPQNWINGYDCNDVEGLGTFDLPATPTAIAVKPDGTVWLKYNQALNLWISTEDE